jgi:hypothetical protein
VDNDKSLLPYFKSKAKTNPLTICIYFTFCLYVHYQNFQIENNVYALGHKIWTTLKVLLSFLFSKQIMLNYLIRDTYQIQGSGFRLRPCTTPWFRWTGFRVWDWPSDVEDRWKFCRRQPTNDRPSREPTLRDHPCTWKNSSIIKMI